MKVHDVDGNYLVTFDDDLEGGKCQICGNWIGKDSGFVIVERPWREKGPQLPVAFVCAGCAHSPEEAFAVWQAQHKATNTQTRV